MLLNCDLGRRTDTDLYSKKYTDARHTATFGRFCLNKLYVLWCLEKPRSLSCKFISPINVYTNNQLFSRSKAGEWRHAQKRCSIRYDWCRGDSLTLGTNPEPAYENSETCRGAKPRTLALTFQHAPTIQPGDSATRSIEFPRPEDYTL